LIDSCYTSSQSNTALSLRALRGGIQHSEDEVTQPDTSSNLSVHFLAEGEQQPHDIAILLASFIRGAQRSLDIAIYDFRLSEPLQKIIAAALADAAAAGVTIRIAYDADKPETPNLEAGMDPASPGTGSFVQSLGYSWRRIGGLKLMHNKYIVRDAGAPGASVWTGSTNFTDDAWALQENNILVIPDAPLAAAYARDFADLWAKGVIEDTGAFDTQHTSVSFHGEDVSVQVLFSPGRGPVIDYDVGKLVAQARRRVRICSMLLNSTALIAALSDLLRTRQAPVSGIYDRTQMISVLQQWQDVPHNHWKIGAVQDIVDAARLVGKNSTPYSPESRHDFMHNKVLVVDDTIITGSYNFSHSAEQNAENLLMLTNPPLADAYSAYVDHLMQKYGSLVDHRNT
jgi:phosphatidylserine/phosphatidylglycerophosphate/cardiolipin synthase-like enzyme